MNTEPWNEAPRGDRQPDMKMPNLLPDSFLRCLSPQDRKKHASGQITKEEAMSRAVAKNERTLQCQIVNLLRLKGIEVLWHRTDKRSAATIGWPDLTFCFISRGSLRAWISANSPVPCAWEIKLPNGYLSPEQESMMDKLTANGWRYKVIRSVNEALVELREMGIE